jgi:hypothetical protein
MKELLRAAGAAQAISGADMQTRRRSSRSTGSLGALPPSRAAAQSVPLMGFAPVSSPWRSPDMVSPSSPVPSVHSMMGGMPAGQDFSDDDVSGAMAELRMGSEPQPMQPPSRPLSQQSGSIAFTPRAVIRSGSGSSSIVSPRSLMHSAPAPVSPTQFSPDVLSPRSSLVASAPEFRPRDDGVSPRSTPPPLGVSAGSLGGSGFLSMAGALPAFPTLGAPGMLGGSGGPFLSSQVFGPISQGAMRLPPQYVSEREGPLAGIVCFPGDAVAVTPGPADVETSTGTLRMRAVMMGRAVVVRPVLVR